MMEQEPLGIIYIIINKINGKVYIGQTRKPLEERMRHHFSKYETCRKLKEAITKYNKDNFTYSVLELVPHSKLNERETYYIKLYNSVINGYNIKVGNSKFKGRKIHSIEHLSNNIIEDYKNHVNTKDIAEKYKIALASVYNVLKRNNIKKRYNLGSCSSIAKINLDELAHLKQQGWQTAQIAKYFNVAKSSVKRMVNRHKNIIFPRVSDISASNVGDENVL